MFLMKYFILFSTVAMVNEIVTMASKPGRMVSYLDWILPIKLIKPLVPRSRKITWQTKTIIPLLPQCIWLPNWQDGNLSRWTLSHKVKWLFDHVVLLDCVANYKPLHLYYHSVYGHQIWQVTNLCKGPPRQIVTWPFNHVTN